MLDRLPEELLLLILCGYRGEDAGRRRYYRRRCRLETLDILNVRAVCKALRDVVHHNQHHLLRDLLPAAHLVTGVESWQREAVRFAFKEDILSSERCFSNSGRAVFSSSPSSLKLELIARPLAVCFYVSDRNRMITSIYDEHARQVYCGETTLNQAFGDILFRSSKARRGDPGAGGEREEDDRPEEQKCKGNTSFALSHLHLMPCLGGVGRRSWRMHTGDVLYALRFMSRNMADSVSIRFRHYIPEAKGLVWRGISSMASAIRVLELSNIQSIADEEFADVIKLLHHVEELDLNNTCAGEQVLWSLVNLHHLKKLNLSHCPNLEKVSDSSLDHPFWSVEARLVELKLSSSCGSRRPRFNRNDLSALEYFDMSNTPSLAVEDIAILLRSAPNLRVVKLLSCAGLGLASSEDGSKERQPCRQDPSSLGDESCAADDPNSNAKPDARSATPRPTSEHFKDDYDLDRYPGSCLARCLPPCLRHLSIGWGFELCRPSSAVLPDCLSSIELGVGTKVSDEGLMVLGSSCRQLHAIKLTMLALSEAVLTRVFLDLPQLQCVDVNNCVLCLGDSLLYSLEAKLMTRLSLVGQISFSKESIGNFLSHPARKSMEELVLKFIPQESIPGFIHGLRGFRSINVNRLKLLDLESSSPVGCGTGLRTKAVVVEEEDHDEAWRGEECFLTGLETLSLRHVCMIHLPSIAKWMENCPRLSQVVIDDCDVATDRKSQPSVATLVRSAFAHLEIQRVQVVMCKRGLLNNRFDSKPVEIFGE